MTISNDTDEVRNSTFKELVKHYQKREIFEKKGRYLSLRPFPLAILLAQEWFENTDKEKFYEIIKEIQELDSPHDTILIDSLSEQLKYLKYSDNAKQIIETIVGENSPFDSTEVLNTELGSRLFRSFVEVNPVAISDNLYRQFNNKKTEELLEFKEGRRNIIWTLEKQ